MSKKKTSDPFAITSEKYEIERAVNTLVEAEKVKKNKPLFQKAKSEMKRQADTLTSLVKGSKR